MRRRTVLATNPSTIRGRTWAETRMLLFGLAPGGACRATFLTVGAVGSYPTVSALPVLTCASHRRSILCGAIPKITLGGRYPPPYPRGARTFLEHLRTRGRPADWRAHL